MSRESPSKIRIAIQQLRNKVDTLRIVIKLEICTFFERLDVITEETIKTTYNKGH
jgi:hypothetical protein